MVPDWVTLNPKVALVRVGSAVYLILPGSEVTSFDGLEAESMAALQEELLGPVEGSTVFAELGEDLLGRLLERHLLLGGERAELERLRPQLPPEHQRPLKRLVFGACGTVATSMVVPQMVLLAIDSLAEHVDVVLTESARRFVRLRVLRYLGARTFTDGFASQPGAAVPHIHLAQGAEAVLIAPASAATIARLASGACDDLLSLIVAATTAPVIVAPVMNQNMWRHAAIARNVARLREDGIYVVAPGSARPIASRTGEAAEVGTQVGAMGLSLSNLVAVVEGVVELNRT
ncbi:MAG: flavoprotein [Candidatus Sulfomarinibacteraceae bacterium]